MHLPQGMKLTLKSFNDSRNIVAFVQWVGNKHNQESSVSTVIAKHSALIP
jgi:hypothetical protein